MKRIIWHVSMGLQGCKREDELDVEDDATDEQIEAIVREQVYEQIDWGWESAPQPPKSNSGGE